MNHSLTPPYLSSFFKADFYPHPVTHIELIQTHISWVFLTGVYVYKIKKPVNLGFLDFSHIDQRFQACTDELRLNKRLTHNIYLKVIPIVSNGDGFALGKEGDTIDYCVKMRQFEQENIFDKLLTSHQFNPVWMDQLAHRIACFHNTQEACFNPSFGDPAHLWQHIDITLKEAQKHIKTGLNTPNIEQIREKSQKKYKKLLKSLQNRQKNGHIKEGHGDLHLKNIALIDGKPTAFDCIEFSDEFRIIDVLNDIAFLVMDCDAKQRPDLGFRFLSRYLEHTGDYAGLTLLPLYLSYRAGVRGKVSCLLIDESIAAHQKDAQHYFQLAHDYFTPSAAKLFAIGGLSGSGKSHLALLGCGVERAIIIRSDATRKRIANNFPQHALYSQAMHQLTYQAMFQDAKEALHAGFSVILDATFLHPLSRQQAFDLATETQVPLTFLWLNIDKTTLRKRINQRQQAKNDISDADLSVLDMQIKEYRKPQNAGIQFLSNSNRWPQL